MGDVRARRPVLVAFVALVALAAAACGGDDSAGPPTTPTTAAPDPTTTTAHTKPTPTGPKSGDELAKPREVALADAGPAAPLLPVPEPLPTDPFAATSDVIEGTIEIPRIGLSTPLHRGMTLTIINLGPSRWPGTAEPGGLGNMVIAGHRSTWTGPFEHLDLLQPGDQMIVTTPTGRHVYAVTGTDIIDPLDVHIALQSYGHTATLFACHPKGSAAQRIVVRLQLLDAAGQPVDATSSWSLGATPPSLAVTPGDGAATNEDPLTFSEG